MYLRTIARRNRDGSVVRYVQLAHNERHPVSGYAVAKVVHSFGREDQLDRDALARLVASITRYLGPAAQLEMDTVPDGGDGELAFLSSRQLGGTWVLDGLWRRLGIDVLIRELLAGRRCDPQQVERIMARFLETPVQGYLGCCDAIANLDFADDLIRIKAKTLVIAGEADVGTPPAMSQAIAAKIPGAKLAVIPGAAHLSVAEKPAEFAELVERFLLGDATA